MVQRIYDINIDLKGNPKCTTSQSHGLECGVVGFSTNPATQHHAERGCVKEKERRRRVRIKLRVVTKRKDRHHKTKHGCCVYVVTPVRACVRLL